MNRSRQSVLKSSEPSQEVDRIVDIEYSRLRPKHLLRRVWSQLPTARQEFGALPVLQAKSKQHRSLREVVVALRMLHIATFGLEGRLPHGIHYQTVPEEGLE